MNKGQIQIYKTDDKTEIKVNLDNDTVWMDAHFIAKLFTLNRPAVVKHINNIYKSKELDFDSTCSILEQVAADGKRRKMNLNNLDKVISVGYRVNSKQATRFRQLATQRLKDDHLVQGYTLNEKRLAQVSDNLLQLERAVKLIQQSGSSGELQISEATKR